MLELLAPAGSMDALRAAVQNGANAVYLGCGMFNARQSAKNFTMQTLTEAVKYCHVRGVQVHLTLNTLVSDRETADLIELIRHAATSNVDAFIEKAKRFTTIDALTPELLRLFIQRIEIGERAKKHAHSSPQKIRIVYKDIGIVDSEMEKGEQPVHMVTPPDENTDMQLLA